MELSADQVQALARRLLDAYDRRTEVPALTDEFPTLSEADEGIADTLNFDASVGPLMGKTVVTIITLFFFWPVLTAALWRRDPPLKVVAVLTGVLVALGFLMTFPPFFEIFAE